MTFRFQYFGLCKMHAAMRTNALAVFPGGFGTLDEAYWRRMIDFELLIEKG